MSTLRRIDNLLDKKTSDQLASDVAARERARAEQQQPGHGQSSKPSDVAGSPRKRDPKLPRRPTLSSIDLRPLVARKGGNATEAIYGLVLALSVIAVSWYNGPAGAGRVGLSVLGTAVAFWLAHVYADVLGRGVSQGERLTRAAVAHAMSEHWPLIEVIIPLLLVLGLGALHVIGETAAIVAATVMATVELGSAGGYAAFRRGATTWGVIAWAATGMTLGVVVVVLKTVAFAH